MLRNVTRHRSELVVCMQWIRDFCNVEEAIVDKPVAQPGKKVLYYANE